MRNRRDPPLGFRPFPVDAALCNGPLPDAVFLHCLPASSRREVTETCSTALASECLEQESAHSRMHSDRLMEGAASSSPTEGHLDESFTVFHTDCLGSEMRGRFPDFKNSSRMPL